MAKTKKIIVQDTEISVILSQNQDDYICLTDMAKFKDNDSTAIIGNWLRNRNTIEYLGVWEMLHNPDFNPIEFEGFRNSSGLNSFTMSPKKWVERTNAIGIVSRAGRYGGTFAQKDIAFNFGMWLSPTFQLYVVQEYQRLIQQEHNPLLQHWDVKRLLTKINYSVHTDAIKEYIIPKLSVSQAKQRIIYAEEADLLNLALFRCTAKDWADANPELSKKMNIRDTATINQLIVLANMESYNSEMIKNKISRKDRFSLLRKMAKEQLVSLDKHNSEHRFRKIISKNDTKKIE